MRKAKMLILAVSIFVGSFNYGLCQNVLQFTSVNVTPENAIQLHWASNPTEVYEIDYADSLIDTNTGTTTWNMLCNDYPSQGTNSFFLDTGNYYQTPTIVHPKDSPMRFYRVVLTGDDTAASEPTISIISPSNGTTVSNNITVSVSARSADVLAEVNLYVDGQEMQPSDDGTNFIINTCEWWNGVHTLFATAKSVSHFEGIANDTSITYGHSVSSCVNLTFNNLISEVAFSQQYFEPSLGQTQEVTANLALNSDWTLQIQDINSNTVRTATGSGNYLVFDWDGTGDGGSNIPDGVYTFQISATPNGQPNQQIVRGGSGGGTSQPPTLSMAADESATQLWVSPDGSESVLPFAIYPPGFDTNGLTIFEATKTDIQSLIPPRLRVKSSQAKLSNTKASNAIANSITASPDGVSGGASGQSTIVPLRPPNIKGKGTVGTFYVGYQTYFTYQFASFSTPPILAGWPYPVPPQYVQLDGETSQSQASKYQTWGSVYENAEIASGFTTTMQNSRWKGASNSKIAASDVTGGIFNQYNIGLLCVHASYGTIAETDGIKHSYLRFFNTSSQSPSYCRLDDCNFGGGGTNGLKWMAILACNALNNADYNSYYEYGKLPINNNLHELLGASTVATAAPTLGSLWAGNMLGTYGTNGVQPVALSWFLAGQQAYLTETNNITINFRVVYWPDAINDYITDTDLAPGTGNPLDIQKQDETVFSNP